MKLNHSHLLLNPDAVEGGTFTPTRASDVQVETLKASAPVATSTREQAPPPEALKGTLDISGIDDISYAQPPTENSKEFDKAPKVKPAAKPEEVPTTSEDVKPQLKVEPAIKTGLSAKLPTIEELKTLETPAVKLAPEARDYTIFPEEQREYLKKTSNEAFEFLKETYKKSKAQEVELTTVKSEMDKIQKGGMPANWYEHPDSWRLHPEGQRNISTLQRIEFEEQHWQEQLQRIENGEKFQMLRGYDKNGNPVFGEPLEPNKEIATRLVVSLGQLGAQKQQAAVQLNSFAQRFGSEMQRLNGEVDKIIETEFPWSKDEKAESHKHVKEFLDSTAGILPAKSQATRVAAYLYANFKKLEGMYAEALKTKKVEELKTETKVAIEPSVRSPSVGGAPKSGVTTNGNGRYAPPAVFSLDGM